MKLDFLKKLAGMGGDLEGAAASRYGDAYGKAGRLGKIGMRLASMPQDEEEEDLSPSGLSLKPRMPTNMDPREIYGRLYSSYGGRKMRGLLFD